MFGLVPLELRVRVRRRGIDGWTGPGQRVGLRARGDPWQRRGRIWQWVVEVDAGLPALRDVLADSRGFLVDDECGRAVGVVEDAFVDHDDGWASGRLIVLGWGGQRICLTVDDVVEVAPRGRRLVIACRADHGPHQRDTVTEQVRPRVVAVARRLLARLIRQTPRQPE